MRKMTQRIPILKTILFLLAGFGVTGGASVADAAPALDLSSIGEAAKRLSLTDCFRLALDSAESLKIQEERVLQAESLRRQAIGSILPSVDFHGSYTRDSDVISFGGVAFSPQDRTEAWFTLSQTIFDGRVFQAVDLAAETRRIEALILKDVRERLLFEVASAFYLILALEQDARAIGASRTRNLEFVRVLEVRSRAGSASEREVLLARAVLEEAKSSLILVEHEVERARLRLARLLGADSLWQELDDTLEVAGPPGEIAQLQDTALASRFDLATARAELDRAEVQKDMARADYLPEAHLDFNHWTAMEGGFNELIDWTLALSVDWNLYDGGAREARLKRARSVIRERELQYSRMEKDVRMEVEDASLAYRSLDRSMQAFESRMAAASESRKMTEAQFKGGEATNLDVLVAEEILEDAERNLARAQFARKLSALRIRLAMGDLAVAMGEAP